MSKDKRSDEELAQAFLDGDHEALDILLERYQAEIWHYARRLSRYKDDSFIDDIRQQVLLIIFKGMKEGAFHPAETGSFRKWVHAVIRHKCIDANKYLSYQPAAFSQVYTAEEIPEDLPDKRQTEPEEPEPRDERIERLLVGLTGEERQLLFLMAEYKSYQEIHEIPPFDKYNIEALRQKTCRLRRTLIELYKNATTDKHG